MKTLRISFLVQAFFLLGCSGNNPKPEAARDFTIFLAADVHGQLSNFAKVKHIVDNENIQPLTTAETIIAYLQNGYGDVNYPLCYNHFRY